MYLYERATDNFHKRAEKANRERNNMLEKAESELEEVGEDEMDEPESTNYPPGLVKEVRKLDQKMKESGTSVTLTSSDGKMAHLGATEFTPKASGQVNLDGEEAKYPIDHEVTTTVTHKFSSAIAKVSISEKAYEKEMEKDRPDILGLVKTKIKVAPSVEGPQWEALAREFAAAVEEEM